MARIVIRGVKPYDGEYELDEQRVFNAREWRWIKRVSGYMPFTIEDGFAGGDPDLFVALAVIAMCRDGKVDRDDALKVADVIAEVPFDGSSITLVGDESEVEADVIPPVLTSGPEESSPKGSLENNSSPTPSPASSGTSSPTGSEKSDETLLSTGGSKSDTGSASDPVRLVS